MTKLKVQVKGCAAAARADSDSSESASSLALRRRASMAAHARRGGRAHATGGVTPAYAATVLGEAAAAALLTPIVLGLSYQPTQAMTDLLSAVETCPRALHAPRDAICAVAAILRRRLFGGASLVDEHGSALLAVNGFVLMFQLVVLGREVSLLEVASRMGALMALILAGSAVTKLRPTSSAPSLDALAARLGVAAEQRALRELRDALASARSEAAMLHAAGEALAHVLETRQICGWTMGILRRHGLLLPQSGTQGQSR
jgi:hypothetical protein